LRKDVPGWVLRLLWILVAVFVALVVVEVWFGVKYAR
jgi:hypothetical protein